MANNQNGDMSVSEAGHKGGEQTSKSHGKEFYQQIGHEGGEKGGKRVSQLVSKGKQVESQKGE